MPNISVITPAFRPRGFEALAQAMADNADVSVEWIVVDDGSGTEYDRVFASLPVSVALLRLPMNQGQAAARNAGLSKAKGEWIKFLDADDALGPGHLAALLKATKTGADAAIPFAPTKHVFAGGQTSINDSWRGVDLDDDAQFLRQMVRPFLHHCGALFPRAVLQDLGGYDASLITDEDGDLLLRILMGGYHFEPVEGVNYLYIHHDTGTRVSSDDDIAKLHARIRVCDKIEAAYGKDMPPEVAEALAQRMDKIAMNYWRSFPKPSRDLLDRAQVLCPRYEPDIRAPLRLARTLGGPRLALMAQALHRRLKGRPKGGAQG